MSSALLPEEIESLARRVVEENRAANRKVVLAESCTGGLVAAALTEIPGSSAVLDRGFVTYSNEAKQESLGVPLEIIETFGAGFDRMRMGHGKRRSRTLSRGYRCRHQRSCRAGWRYRPQARWARSCSRGSYAVRKASPRANLNFSNRSHAPASAARRHSAHWTCCFPRDLPPRSRVRRVRPPGLRKPAPSCGTRGRNTDRPVLRTRHCGT